ncbi:MAG: hypothetical protein LAT67_01365 [Balneolales bacterium]|nr:hypothetical protein [Balneolales bacterium]
MSAKNKSKNFNAFKINLKKNLSREKAIDEALSLLEENLFTSDDAENEVQKIEQEKRVEADDRFKKISEAIRKKNRKQFRDRDEALDEVLLLLDEVRLTSDDAIRVKRKRKMFHAVLNTIFGMVVICLAAILIVVDPPAWLKGPTLIYFNPNDGATVSDVIAILMIGFGTLFIFLGFAEIKKGK